MSARGRRHADAYGALLWLEPRQFRREYRHDMVQLFCDDLLDRGAARAWARGLTDLIVSVPIHHWEAHMSRPASSSMIVLKGILAVSAVIAMAALFGRPAVILVPVALAAMAFALVRQGLQPYREVSTRASDRWFRYVAAGALMLLVQALSVEFGPDWLVVPWGILVLNFLVAWILLGTGVLLGLVALVHRFRPSHAA